MNLWPPNAPNKKGGSAESPFEIIFAIGLLHVADF